MKNIILIICVFLFSCYSKESKTNRLSENQTEDMVINEPIYRIRFVSSQPYELYVNNILLSKGDKGNTELFETINEYVLKKGPQQVSVVLYPKNEKSLFKIEDLKIELYKSEGLESEEYKLIKKLPLPNEPNSTLKWEVDLTDIPYENIGWSNSKDLRKIDQEKLYNDVLNFYKEAVDVINKGDYQSYLTLFKEADKEIFTSLYANNQMIESENTLIKMRIIDSKGKTHLENSYYLKFYADGKIVCLEDDKGNSPIVANRENLTSYYGFLLHIPNGTEDLKIIR